jgi:oligopeptidase B
VLVYQDDDERFNLGAGRTRDGKFIVLESASHITSESWVLAAAEPEGQFTLITPRDGEHEYSIDHRNGLWFIRTNDRGRNFRLVTAPVATPGREHWTELIPHRDSVMIEEVDLFADFFIACEREDGLPRLRVGRFRGDGPTFTPSGEISFPEPAYSAQPHINRIFDTPTFRYAYQSLVTPASVYEYDVATGASTLLKQLEIPGGFDRTLYASERIYATATDGVKVPVSLVYRKDKREPGRNPLYVYGYGSYGYSLPLGFSSNRLSLLDRGVVMAYAHIRGGGDLGKPWHDAGKMLVKRNTFTDFIAAVEHLTAARYGDPARVAIEGGSAGGLLMGAVVNLRPELFRAVLSHVPFVDVMNTMLDASLPLTVPEYEEWGNPNDSAYFSYMLSYSQRRTMSTEYRNFLALPYEELEELNLAAKADRANRVAAGEIREKRLKYLTDEKRIKAVTVLFSDLEGRLHLLDYDKKFLLGAHENLTFDGSSIRGFTAQKESDLRLGIDWGAFYWVPADVFGTGKVLVFGNVIDKDGTAYSGDLRGVLKGYADKQFKEKATTR